MLLAIGFDATVNTAEVVAILPYGSSGTVKAVQYAKKVGLIIDNTRGRRTRSVIFTRSQHVVASSASAEALTERWRQEAMS